MTHLNATCAPSHRHPARPVPYMHSLLSILALWRSRRALAALSAEQLADVGLNARQAHCEAARAPWDVPAHWRN